MITKPMLAGTCEDLNSINFPVLATPKLDGIRCLIVNGKALTRTFKPIPNHHVRETLEKAFANSKICYDGELMVPGCDFNEIQSFIMSHDGKPNFEYHIFDRVEQDLKEPYCERMSQLFKTPNLPAWVTPVQYFAAYDISELSLYEGICLSNGFEGVMIRSPKSPYKCGRSTVKEQYLLKIKRFQDDEGEVIGFTELMHNTNEKKTNELGYAKRSSAKAGMVGAGMLGAFSLRDLKTGIEFEVSTGMTEEQRIEFWEKRDQLIGKLIKYKHQPSGSKEKPRFPVFLGFRSEDDL